MRGLEMQTEVATLEIEAGGASLVLESPQPTLEVAVCFTLPSPRPTVTGSKEDNAALGSLISVLAGLGLITDSTT